MLWRFDDKGEWEAESAVHEGESWNPQWRIQMCEDGTFDVNQSDPGLIAGKCKTWKTLKNAMDYCESAESTRVALSTQEPDPKRFIFPFKVMQWKTLQTEDGKPLVAAKKMRSVGFIPVYESIQEMAADHGKNMKCGTFEEER